MYSDLMSIKMATLVSGGNFDTHSNVISIALTYSSYEHVKSSPLRLILSTTVLGVTRGDYDSEAARCRARHSRAVG